MNHEIERLAERIAAQQSCFDATLAGKRLIALDVSRGDQMASAHYATLCTAQAEIERDLEILHFAVAALNAPANTL